MEAYSRRHWFYFGDVTITRTIYNEIFVDVRAQGRKYRSNKTRGKISRAPLY